MSELPVTPDFLKMMFEAEVTLWQNTYFMLLQQTNADFDVALSAADQALGRFRVAFDLEDEEEEESPLPH